VNAVDGDYSLIFYQ